MNELQRMSRNFPQSGGGVPAMIDVTPVTTQVDIAGPGLKRDYAGLAKLPRDASPIRLVNRCSMSGRRRGYLRKFGCSRLTFREGALNGLIPGVTKASW